MILVSKATVAFSNVPGPLYPYKFGEHESKEMIGMIPGIGDLAFGVSAVSHGKVLRMAVQADVVYLKDPKALTRLLEKNYDRVVEAYNHFEMSIHDVEIETPIKHI